MHLQRSLIFGGFLLNMFSLSYNNLVWNSVVVSLYVGKSQKLQNQCEISVCKRLLRHYCETDALGVYDRCWCQTSHNMWDHAILIDFCC